MNPLSNRTNADVVAKFISDHHSKTLLVERVPTLDPEDEEEGEGGGGGGGSGPQSLTARRLDSAANSFYNLSVNVQFSGPR